jgi:hypothetical protein
VIVTNSLFLVLKTDFFNLKKPENKIDSKEGLKVFSEVMLLFRTFEKSHIIYIKFYFLIGETFSKHKISSKTKRV